MESVHAFLFFPVPGQLLAHRPIALDDLPSRIRYR
jgi:hypothetical protein